MGKGEAEGKEGSGVRRRHDHTPNTSLRPPIRRVAGLDPAPTSPTGYAVLESTPTPRLLALGESDLHTAVTMAKAPIVAVDAPLHPPYHGFRRVERKALALGARLLPGGTPGMQALSMIGYSIAQLLWETGRRPLETHPSTIARILGVDKRALWRRAGGRHAGDALLAALAGLCYLRGEAVVLEEQDGTLILPARSPECVKILGEILG